MTATPAGRRPPTPPPAAPVFTHPAPHPAFEPWPRHNGAHYRPPAPPQPPPAQPAPGSHAPLAPPLGGRPTRRRSNRLLTAVGTVIAVGGTLAVTAAAFALSFDGIRATAIAAYIRPDLAWLFPVAVDGAMSVAVVCAVLLRQLGRPNRYPWFVVLATSAISIACNALHAYIAGGSVWAMAVSAAPAVLLALSVHLVVMLATTALAEPPPAAHTADRAAAAPPPRRRTTAPPPRRRTARPRKRTAAPPPTAPPTAPLDRTTADRTTADRTTAPPGGKPTIEQLVATLRARHPGVTLSRRRAAATLRDEYEQCSDERVDAAREIHNAQLAPNDGREAEAV